MPAGSGCVARPCVAAAAIVLGSPLIGDLRQALLRAPSRATTSRSSRPRSSPAASLLLAFCLRAITTDRPRRIGILGLAAALAVASFAALRSGNANVDAVEAFHFVEYGVLTLLFFPFGPAGPALGGVRRGRARDDGRRRGRRVVPVVRARPRRRVARRALRPARDRLRPAAVSGARRTWPRVCPSDRRGPGLQTRAPCSEALGLASAPRWSSCCSARSSPPSISAAEIRDPEIGTFRSRFSGARLHELGAERAREWAGGPPPVAGRYGREDQYEAEALWHVRRRNFGMDPDRKGDPLELDVAWHENLILERYFGPVLDAASAGGGAPATGWRPSSWPTVDARRAHGATRRSSATPRRCRSTCGRCPRSGRS